MTFREDLWWSSLGACFAILFLILIGIDILTAIFSGIFAIIVSALLGLHERQE